MCDCDKSYHPNSRILQSGTSAVTVVNHSTCSGILISLLRSWKTLVSCTLENNLTAYMGLNKTEVENANSILDQWIIAKTNDPDTCEFRDKLPVIQIIVTQIVSKGKC